MFDRNVLIDQLRDTSTWDVLIIGGGATGLGLAVDGASRGYKTLLAEQADFAKGTSSRSTKLVHGGVRYLAQGNIRLVKEALHERGYLLKNAPHLTENTSFIIPCYSWFRGLFYTAGLKLYDALAGSLSLGKSRLIGRSEVLRRLPGIDKQSLKCGVLYHDGIFDDARLAVNLAQTAISHGATVLNYLKVESLIKDDGNLISGAVLSDVESGNQYRIRAKVVINATGVFSDEILQLDNPMTPPTIRPSQGVHLVLDQDFLQSHDAIMIPHTDDGRVLFAVPWHNKVLVGTTDTPLKSHSLEPRALEKEINFILRNAGRYLVKKPGRSDVRSVFAGLRPLAANNGNTEKTKEISRSHKVIVSKSGLVSIIGGKWTTYRKMAEDTFSEIIRRQILSDVRCITSRLPIQTFPNSTSTFEDDNSVNLSPDLAKDRRVSLPELPVIFDSGSVLKAIRFEMARTVEDVLARRMRFLFLDAHKAWHLATEVAEIMAQELGKDESWKENQVSAFRRLAEGYMIREEPGAAI